MTNYHKCLRNFRRVGDIVKVHPVSEVMALSLANITTQTGHKQEGHHQTHQTGEGKAHGVSPLCRELQQLSKAGSQRDFSLNSIILFFYI